MRVGLVCETSDNGNRSCHGARSTDRQLWQGKHDVADADWPSTAHQPIDSHMSYSSKSARTPVRAVSRGPLRTVAEMRPTQLLTLCSAILRAARATDLAIAAGAGAGDNMLSTSTDPSLDMLTRRWLSEDPRRSHADQRLSKRALPATVFCPATHYWSRRFCEREKDMISWRESCWRPPKTGAELYQFASTKKQPLPEHTRIPDEEELTQERLNGLKKELGRLLMKELALAGVEYVDKAAFKAEVNDRYWQFGVYDQWQGTCPLGTTCHQAVDDDKNTHVLCMKQAPDNVPAADEWYEPYGVFRGYRRVDVRDLHKGGASDTANTKRVSIKRTWYIDRAWAEASLSIVAYNPHSTETLFPELAGVVSFEDANDNWFDLTMTLFTHNKHCTMMNLFSEECPAVSVFDIKAGTWFQYESTILSMVNGIVIEMVLMHVPRWDSVGYYVHQAGKVARWIPTLRWIYSGFNPNPGPPGEDPPPLPPGHGFEDP